MWRSDTICPLRAILVFAFVWSELEPTDRAPLANETLLVLPLTLVAAGPEAVNAVAVNLDTLYCPVTLSFRVRFASELWSPLRVIAVDLPTASFTLVPVLVLM